MTDDLRALSDARVAKCTNSAAALMADVAEFLRAHEAAASDGGKLVDLAHKLEASSRHLLTLFSPSVAGQPDE